MNATMAIYGPGGSWDKAHESAEETSRERRNRTARLSRRLKRIRWDYCLHSQYGGRRYTITGKEPRRVRVTECSSCHSTSKTSHCDCEYRDNPKFWEIGPLSPAEVEAFIEEREGS